MVKSLNNVSKRILRRVFEPRERVLLAQAGEMLSPPIFLVGPPRAGTTLIYQSITSGLRTAYFCNFAAWYAQTPVAASEFVRDSIVSYESDFTSDYGKVAGRGAPAEAETIWKAWLGRDRNDGSDLSKDTVVVANRTVAALQKMLDAPFVAKDVSNSLRTRALDRLFPGCLFVRVSREPAEIAQSILSARHSYRQERGCAQTDNPVEEWIFIDSKDYEQFHDRPYLEQIANQVFHTENMLEEDLAKLPEARVFRVAYDDFCRDPRGQIEKLAGFAATHGIRLRAKAPLPAAFRTRLRGEGKEGVRELKDMVRRLYSGWEFAGQE
jgi:hypothetical protein